MLQKRPKQIFSPFKMCILNGPSYFFFCFTHSLLQDTLTRAKGALQMSLCLNTQGNTSKLGLKLQPSEPPLQIVTYVDAYWTNHLDDQKSWSSHIFLLNNNPIQWRVTKQTCMAVFPMEAKFISASEAAKEIKFILDTIQEVSKFFPHLFQPNWIQQPIMLCDNIAAIFFIKTMMDNVCTCHINLKYRFVGRSLPKRCF